MCNACGFLCCAHDGFSGCGCDDCDCPDCWSDDGIEFDNDDYDYDYDYDYDSEKEDRYPPPQVIDEWRSHCSCCPHCCNHPCDGVAAGGMCDSAECDCFDDYDS